MVMSIPGFEAMISEEMKNMSIISHLPEYLMVPWPFLANGTARLTIVLEYSRVDDGVSLKSPIATIFLHPTPFRESVISPSRLIAASLLQEEFAPYFEGW